MYIICNYLRKITIEIDEKRYFHFLAECNIHGMTVSEQLHEIINYYVIIQKRRPTPNFTQSKLNEFKK